MKKKKITFKKLCKLVSEIDYVNEDSFPFSIEVKYWPGKPEEFSNEYDFGIGDFSEYGPDWANEWQFIKKWGEDDTPTIIDLQEPDSMTYEGIVEMLKKKLYIDKDTEIYLWDDGFDGERLEDTLTAGDFAFSGEVVKELKGWNSPTEEEEEV